MVPSVSYLIRYVPALVVSLFLWWLILQAVGVL